MNIEALEEFRKLSYEDQWTKRREFILKYGWAIPNQRAIEAISACGPIVEIGAGAGYWAHLLRQAGTDVVAYDESPYKNNWCNHPGWTEVLVGGTEKAAEHPDRALFLCWPPYDQPMAVSALDAYVGAGGKTLIYVGEGEGGCTGDDAFHELLGAYELIETTYIPQWPGIHDVMMVYRIPW